MDVDPTPLPSSSSKRPADFSLASSSAEKRANILPDEQLIKLSSKMNAEKKYKYFLDGADRDDSMWRDLVLMVFMDLTLELASTDMRDSVITNLTIDRANDIVKSFNEDQLEEWKVDVRNGVRMGYWVDLLERPELKRPNIAPTFESREQEDATKKSWERPYCGQAAEALWAHIQKHYRPNNTDVYAHFCSVVQSSGMGKSRTVDELGKKRFSIPINLRDAQSTGYPPADHKVRNFLTPKLTEAESYHRACCFIDALFQHTNDTLEQEFDSQWGIEEVAREFRVRMTAGQTMKEHNEFRRRFYQRVVQIAEQKFAARDVAHPGYISPPTSIDAPDYYKFPPAASCNKLIKSLNARKDLSLSRQVSRKIEGSYPLVILAFDEAHTLTNREETDCATWSNFSVLRHVFRALYRFPLFVLFLSTTDKISKFTSPDEDTSKRITHRDLKSIQPFTDLGFDTLAKRVTLNSNLNLKDVTDDSHIVRMGRPLFGSRWDAGDLSVREDIVTFAVGKLLNANPSTRVLTLDQKLACLSQRLPIQFNSTTYISQTTERKQVEGHMRVCLKIDAALQSMVTVSSSEPLLSEAAYVIMAHESFDPLNSFKSVMEGFAVHQGDHGEFLALLLLTLARDQAVGLPNDDGRPECRYFDFVPFMRGRLFKFTAPGLWQLESDFPDPKMHFNHFVKFHDFKSIDKECLLLLMTRGAGVLCANNQASIDAIIVFLRSGTELTIKNLGLVLFQFKNDPSYSQNPQPELFKSMDPYKRGILKEGEAAVPIVKIIFALAAQTSGLHVKRHDASRAYNAVVYEIWCAGLSSDFLNPIRQQQTGIWDSLLQASYGWKEIYGAATNVEKDLRRSMNPGAADDGGHWSRWAVRGAK